jgi:hypothetical protein
MRTTKRVLALALTGLLLAACSHKDKDAPLAFVPADTPYVLANLDVLDDDARQALMTELDIRIPAEVAQLKAEAAQVADANPDAAKFLLTVAGELDGKTAEQISQQAGIDPKGRMALYGLGLSPVLRIELSDPAAFQNFVTQFETDNGKKFEAVTIGQQSYQRYVASASHLQLIVAVVGKQAVLSVLPDDADQSLLRQALGMDRPAKNMQDSDRLTQLAKDKGYAPWSVGLVDVARMLPLIAGNQDPLSRALLKARAEEESAKTGEPVANLMQVPPSCQADAARIASRVPQVSGGYVTLDDKQHDMRFDVSLANDIVSAFNNLKVELPGLGSDPSAPLEISMALPVPQLRAFVSAQADAVAAKPFSCPLLDNLNDNFSSLGDGMQKAAVPPIGDLLGVHVALDSYTPNPGGGMPKVSGRFVIASNNAPQLLTMAQITGPLLAGIKLSPNGVPTPLPAQLINALGEQGWAAMTPKALGMAVGDGEDAKFADMLKQPIGDAGQLMRMRIDSAMYASWADFMEQKAENLVTMEAAMNPANGGAPVDQKTTDANVAYVKAQYAAKKQEAARMQSQSIDVRMGDQGLIVRFDTEMK